MKKHLPLNVILYLMLLITGFKSVYGQSSCVPPTSFIATPASATCLNNGAINVSDVQGGSGSYLYSIISDLQHNYADTGVWTTSASFLSLAPGTYIIAVRSTCGVLTSDSITQTVTVASTYQPLSATVSATLQTTCQPGSFTVSASGGNTSVSGGYTYQQVISATDPTPVGAVQSSPLFSGLNAGTYYVKITDDCGSSITRQAIIGSASASNPYTASSLGAIRTACGQFAARFQLTGTNSNLAMPYTVSLMGPSATTIASYTPSAQTTIDSFIDITAYLTNVNLSTVQGHQVYGPFYQKLTDGCGNTYYSDSLYIDTILLPGSVSLSTNISNCSTTGNYNVIYAFAGADTIAYQDNKLYLIPGTQNFSGTIMYTGNGGQSWQSASSFPGTSVQIYPAGTFGAAVCGDTAFNEIQVTPPTMSVALKELNRGSCSGKSGMYILPNGTGGFSGNNFGTGTLNGTYIKFLSVPAGAPAILTTDSFYIASGGKYSLGLSTTGTNYLINLPVGTYTFRLVNECGQTEDSSIQLSLPLSNVINIYQMEGNCTNNETKLHARPQLANLIFNTVNPQNRTFSLYYQFIRESDGQVLSSGWTGHWVDIYYTLQAADTGFITFKFWPDQTLTGLTDFCPVSKSIYVPAQGGALSGKVGILTCGSTTGTVTVTPIGGYVPYTYILKQNGTTVASMSNQTAPVTFSPAITIADSAAYTVTIADACGQSVTLGIHANPASFYLSNIDGQDCLGQSLTLAAPYFSNAGYSWTHNGNSMDNTGSTYSLEQLSYTDTGNYVITAAIAGCTQLSAALDLSGTACQALPVKLADFGGRLTRNGVLLSWEVAEEHHLAAYILERSVDGRAFSVLAQMPPTGSNSYGFTDSFPASMNYYRLKMADIDGTFTYSKVVSIAAANKEMRMQLYPIPFSDHIAIVVENGQSTGHVQVRLTSVDGKTLLNKSYMLNGNKADITGLGSLPAGSYILTVTTAEGYNAYSLITKQ